MISMQTNDGYDEMDEAAQTEWDLEFASKRTAMIAFETADRTAAGYDDMSNDGKGVYDAEYL